MAHSICKGIWLKQLLEEVKISSNKPIDVFYDNQVAISITKIPVHHDKIEQEMDRYFIKKRDETFKLIYTPTSLQRADVLTKVLLGQTLKA